MAGEKIDTPNSTVHLGIVRNTSGNAEIEQNRNSLLVKCQNDNTSPGLGRGRLVPTCSSHKGSEFRYAVIRQFSIGDERIREDISVPDSLRKEVFLIGVFTSRGNLKGH